MTHTHLPSLSDEITVVDGLGSRPDDEDPLGIVGQVGPEQDLRGRVQLTIRVGPTVREKLGHA